MRRSSSRHVGGNVPDAMVIMLLIKSVLVRAVINLVINLVGPSSCLIVVLLLVGVDLNLNFSVALVRVRCNMDREGESVSTGGGR